MTPQLLVLGIGAVAWFQTVALRAADLSEPVLALIERIAPGHTSDFLIETINAPAGENVFEVEANAGKIVLRGDGPLSQAVAFNWYLKHEALVSVSWYAEDAIIVPGTLPRPIGKIRRTTKVKDRFFLNYCTFGYTMPFWRWGDWERCIDWMALNGINLPLAQTGNEFIWQKVWRQYGLSDQEIRAFYTGPAHLPWHRMLNIDKWEGPLPPSFIDGQHDLQKQILARERSLGMKPVLCAFAGHVPEALKAKQPSLKIQQIPPGWAGFPAAYGCWFLNPLDPAFKEIQVKFLQAQEEEYGTSHYYGTDPFNEIDPPNWEPAYLAGVSRAIYGGMAKVDPDAVWLQMAWTFFNDRAHWSNERLAAMIHAVPQGHMELIDYVCEETELYKSTEAFCGAPFIWSYLGNFGGNTHLVGPLGKINQRLSEAMSNERLTNFAGVGATLEGFNNPVVYEMLFERIWNGETFDLPAWIQANARARAGADDPPVEQAWDLLREKILVDNVRCIFAHGVIFQARNPSLRGEGFWNIAYSNQDLFHVWELLLKASPAARTRSAYQRDLVDTTRQALGNLGLTLREKMADAADQKDVASFQRTAKDFMTLGYDIDDFLGTRSEFMLGKWLNDAKSWGADDGEKAGFEQNARTIITTWYNRNANSINDYAMRQWNGLMRDYYLPRWQMFIDATAAELQTGRPMDRSALENQMRDYEWKFARATGGEYASKPNGDPFARSRALYEKYSPLTSN
jgi:alpha-N-acetylglucosaminidase